MLATYHTPSTLSTKRDLAWEALILEFWLFQSLRVSCFGPFGRTLSVVLSTRLSLDLCFNHRDSNGGCPFNRLPSPYLAYSHTLKPFRWLILNQHQKTPGSSCKECQKEYSIWKIILSRLLHVKTPFFFLLHPFCFWQLSLTSLCVVLSPGRIIWLHGRQVTQNPTDFGLVNGREAYPDKI